METDSNTTLIQQLFHRVECVRFEPSATATDHQALICCCGRPEGAHNSNQPVANQDGASTAQSDRLQCFPTDATGQVHFPDVCHQNTADYVRLSYNSSPKSVMVLLQQIWNLPAPQMVITVHGGHRNFHLNTKITRALHDGLRAITDATDLWMLTGGFDSGVVCHLSNALSETNRSRARCTCIGIAPWGFLPNRDHLVGLAKSVTVSKQTTNTDESNLLITLNKTQSCFLLADDGSVDQVGCEILLRRRLEEYLATNCPLSLDKSSVEMPFVCLVIEGSAGTVRSVLDVLQMKPSVPVVVVQDSGRFADVLAFCYTNSADNGQIDAEMVPKCLELIVSAFDTTQDQAAEVMGELRLLLRHKAQITIYRVDSDQKLDETILRAALKGAHRRVASQLALTMAWNRADIARSEIFLLGQRWQPGCLHHALTEALVTDRAEFVKLILENGVSVHQFLSLRRLEHLYNSVKSPLNTLKYQMNRDPDKAPDYKLYEIGGVVQSLMGSTYQSMYSTAEFRVEYDQHVSRSPAVSNDVSARILKKHRHNSSSECVLMGPTPNRYQLSQPFGDLLIWAVLTNRHSIALLAWRYGHESLARALVAFKLNKSLAHEAASDYLEVEICDQFMAHAKEFRQHAMIVLEQCYQTDTDRTLQLLTYELTNWGRHTCLSLAAIANHKEFLAHPCCQTLLADLWHGGMRIRRRSDLKVLICILVPPLIAFVDFKTRNELKKQPQTAAQIREATFTSSADNATSSENEHSGTPDELKKSQSSVRLRQASGIVSSDQQPQNLKKSQIELIPLSILNLRSSITKKSAKNSRKRSSNYVSTNTTPRISLDKHIPMYGIKQKADRALKLGQKLREFYTAPITTFWLHLLSYMLFLLMFSFMCLVRTPQWPNWIEYFCVAYVITTALEMFRGILLSQPNTLLAKLQMYLREQGNVITCTAVSIVLLAFTLRFMDEYRSSARVLYTVSSVIWWLRVLRFFVVHNRLGPYITMVGKMMVQMTYIVIILTVVLISFGLVRQSITYPDEDWHWLLVRDVFYKPYFMLYGEVYAGEIAPCGDRGELCVDGQWIVPALMSVFLLVCNILLLNLLVAVFNNIYNQMNSLSHQIWKFQRYAQVMEYEQTPFLPPPLTVLCHFWQLCSWWVGKKRKHRRLAMNNTFDCGLKLFLDSSCIENLREFERECKEEMMYKQTHVTSSENIDQMQCLKTQLNTIQQSQMELLDQCRQLQTSQNKLGTDHELLNNRVQHFIESFDGSAMPSMSQTQYQSRESISSIVHDKNHLNESADLRRATDSYNLIQRKLLNNYETKSRVVVGKLLERKMSVNEQNESTSANFIHDDVLCEFISRLQKEPSLDIDLTDESEQPSPSESYVDLVTPRSSPGPGIQKFQKSDEHNYAHSDIITNTSK